MACLMSYICSMSTIPIVKGATTGLYLRGPSLVPWIYGKNIVIDSFTLLQKQHTMQMFGTGIYWHYCLQYNNESGESSKFKFDIF